MKAGRLWISTVVMASLVAAGASAAFAQMGAGRRGRVPLYNVQTETTVQGMVEEVRTISGPRGWKGTHLTLNTDSGSFDVHLGPASFLKKKGIKFAQGDRVQVTGSKVTFQDKDAILAREVKMGEKVLTLRDARGVPKWAGKHRRW
jgi:hypothetical protein